MTRGWSTASWEDPDGGTILLHGTFPTVVLPRSLWPNPKAWDGLALLDDAGAPEAFSSIPGSSGIPRNFTSTKRWLTDFIWTTMRRVPADAMPRP